MAGAVSRYGGTAVGGVLVACAIGLAGSLTAGATARQVTGQDSGIILGRVVDADSNQPFAGATVTLLPPPGPGSTSETVLSDADGRFVFHSLSPGAYRLRALRFGLIPAEYGQRWPRGPFQRLPVDPNDPVTEATIRMWRPASISGVIRDEVGEPAAGILVRAVQITMAGGRRLLRPAGPSDALSDDRGAYRLRDLAPGQYYVMVPSTVASAATSTAGWYAGARASSGDERELLQQFGESRAPSPSPIGLRVGEHIVSGMSLRSTTAPTLTADGRLEMTRTTYYPSSATIDAATPITVASGEGRDGVDVALTREVAYRVSGWVLGTDGPAALIGVRLISADVAAFDADHDLETSATTSDLDGRFTLLGVPPGDYVVRVLRVPRPERQPRPPTDTMGTSIGGRTINSSAPPAAPRPTLEYGDDAPTLWAQQAISVGDADVGGVSLQLREGARVFGRIVVEGATTDPDIVARLAVQLVPADGREATAFMRPPMAEPDGQFRTMGQPPGRYFPNVVGSIPETERIVRSVMLGDRNLLDQPLELGTDDVTGVVVTITDELGGISGSVAIQPGGDDAALVAVFPADTRSWMANGMASSRTAIAMTDVNARFEIRALRAGAYIAVALPPSAVPDLQDPSVIERLVRSGTPVQVPDRGSASVTLTMSSGR